MPAGQGGSATSDSVEYAIVGAGVSGLYAAWRLVCDRPSDAGKPPPAVGIYEASGRVGGRLLTWLPRGENGGIRAELGGMRFLERHGLVCDLIKEVGLGGEVIPFPVEGPGLRLLLRGRSTPLTIADPGRPYKLAGSHQCRPASQLLGQAAREILTAPENRKHLGGKLPGNREEWDGIKPLLTWGGRELWKLGFWNLLAETGNFEMYQYIRDGFGYYSLAENWNAAEALQSIFLDEPDEEAQPDRIYHSRPGEAGYHTLARGFDSLPRTLRARLKDAECEVCLDTRLVSFKRQDSGWVLRLNGPAGKDRAVEAEKLILALPRTALEQLAPSDSFSLGTDSELRRRVQSVTPIPAFKLFLFYNTRWWERLGITVGRSVSDLPLRQTYYFAPDRKSGRTPDHGLLMASYSDAGAVAFWSSLIQDEPLPGGAAESPWAEFVRWLRLRGGPKPPPDLHEASQEMLRHAKAQLALLHDIPEASIPEPAGGAYACWGAEPGGCGWNFWNPGVQVDQMMPQVRTPLSDAPVCIVGEAYSGIQGWVEGALTTTERALQDHLKLKPPGWLREDYYLGR